VQKLKGMALLLVIQAVGLGILTLVGAVRDAHSMASVSIETSIAALNKAEVALDRAKDTENQAGKTLARASDVSEELAELKKQLNVLKAARKTSEGITIFGFGGKEQTTEKPVRKADLQRPELDNKAPVQP
jgi:hypothetical protein